MKNELLLIATEERKTFLNKIFLSFLIKSLQDIIEYPSLIFLCTNLKIFVPKFNNEKNKTEEILNTLDIKNLKIMLDYHLDNPPDEVLNNAQYEPNAYKNKVHIYFKDDECRKQFVTLLIKKYEK